jgi:transporter family protein
MTWWTYALLSATAAAATAVLAKIGVQGVSSNLATAIRTLVVLLFSCGIVLATVEHP